MGNTREDLTGREFGRLKVIGPSDKVGPDGRKRWWNCECSCGEKRVVSDVSFRSGTQSCGCLSADNSRIRNRKHGFAGTKIYMVWRSMIRRCYEKDHHAYEGYGGRGITVCDRWRESFQNFMDDMGERFNGGTLDRKDNDLGYSPENCRWATRKEQARNRRGNRLLTYAGQTMTVTEWGEKTGFGRLVILARLNNKWSVERALTESVHRKGG